MCPLVKKVPFSGGDARNQFSELEGRAMWNGKESE
jgi:hypothetical protein